MSTTKDVVDSSYQNIIGVSAKWAGQKSPVKIETVRKLESGKEIAVMENGAVVSLDILRDENDKEIIDYLEREE